MEPISSMFNVISNNMVSIINVEKCYTHTNGIEKSSLDCFLSDIQNHADTMGFKYRNLGNGYIEIYGINTVYQYQYTVILYVRYPLEQISDVIDKLRYAVFPVNKIRPLEIMVI